MNTLSELAAQLPNLPGYRRETIPKERYHKTHMFEVQNGVRCEINRDGQLLDHRSMNLTGTHPLAIPTAPQSTSPASTSRVIEAKTQELPMSRLPAWIAFDKKCLRFYCYFTERVHSSPAETWRVRKCVLYYYLEDDSIHIAEPRVENSGIPQGVILKRHRIPKDDGQFIGLDDLYIGAELPIYGQVYTIVDADAATREFYKAGGRELGPALEYPVDNFTAKVAASKTTTHNKMMHPYKQYLEASLGKQITQAEVEATKKFLQNDGKVLRFYCQWDDKNLYGEKRPFVMHYFLADDTVEVLEVQQQNSGRPPFSNLLKRQKLPKDNLNNLDVSRIGQAVDEKARYYTADDFKIGETIMVYGRPLLICGCDPYTKRYYMENYNMKEEDFKPINMEDEPEEVPVIYPPPHTGFGSEEDSLGSYLHLIPKVPKPDFKKLIENEGLALRWSAVFANPSPIDRNRKFVISYYLDRDHISVFEKPERNSGFVGGKFLERGRFKNPDTDEYFRPCDFVPGKEVNINHFIFKIGEPDAFTKRYIEEHPEVLDPNGNFRKPDPIPAPRSIGGRAAGVESAIRIAGAAVSGAHLHAGSAPLNTGPIKLKLNTGPVRTQQLQTQALSSSTKPQSPKTSS